MHELLGESHQRNGKSRQKNIESRHHVDAIRRLCYGVIR